MRHVPKPSACARDTLSTMRDPFLAVPRPAAGVETKEDSKGLIQIRKIVAAKAGLASFLARRLRFRRQLRVNLDELGTLYWKQIDGTRTLRDIEINVRGAAVLNKRESERATLTFTKMLMMRYLIELEIDLEE